MIRWLFGCLFRKRTIILWNKKERNSDLQKDKKLYLSFIAVKSYLIKSKINKQYIQLDFDTITHFIIPGEM